MKSPARQELDRIVDRNRRLKGVGECGWLILLDLADAGEMKTSSVGAPAGVSVTTAKRCLTRLLDLGLVRRRDGDRRIRLISLTNAGRVFVGEMLPGEAS